MCVTMRLQDMRLDGLHRESKHDFTKASRNQVKVCVLVAHQVHAAAVCLRSEHFDQVKDKRKTKQAATDGF